MRHSFSGLLGALLLAGPASAQVQLGPVSVSDQTDKNGLSHAPPLASMPSASLQDTPQAVNVIDQQTIRSQATTTLGDALRNVPGITIAIGEGGTLAGDQFKIRGFDAKDDVYLDGLRDFGAYTRDSFDVEEVQVLKGPSGLMFGRGTTGGAINTISKMPFLKDQYFAAVEGGNGDHVRATADLNVAFSDTGALRLNLMVTDTGVIDRDVVHTSRWGIAPALALGLGTDTQFSLAWLHQHSTGVPDYGIPVAQRPGQLVAEPATDYGVPRSTFLGYNTDRDRNDTDIVTMRLAHQAAPWLTLSNDARAAVYARYFQYTTVDRCDSTIATDFCSNALFGPAPSAAQGGIGGGGPYQQDSWGTQDVATAKADFKIGDFRNIAIAGFDASYQRADRTIYAYTLPATTQFAYTLNDNSQARANIGRSLFHPDPNPPPGYTVFLPTAATIANSTATPSTVVFSSGDATDFAFFATDRFYVTPEWSVIGGVRVDHYLANFASTVVSSTVTKARASSTLVNPRASLVFEPDENSSYYLSYGKSAVPQGTSIVGSPTPITAANQTLAPETGETLELGAKRSFFQGALGLGGSLFTVLKSNALVTDPVSGATTAQSGERDRVQGLELSATGQITGKWNVLAAYTLLDSKVTADNSCTTSAPLICKPNPYTIGTRVIFVPRNAFSLWSSYALDDVVPGLGIGGGAVYQSKLFVRNTIAGSAPDPTGLSRIAVIPRTLEFDAVATYDVGRYHVQFNVNNIADELNYAQSFGNRGAPSAGRTFILSAGVKL